MGWFANVPKLEFWILNITQYIFVYFFLDSLKPV